MSAVVRRGLLAALAVIYVALLAAWAGSEREYLAWRHHEFDQYRVSGVSDEIVDRFWLDFADTVCQSFNGEAPTWDVLAWQIFNEAEGRGQAGEQAVPVFDLPEGDPSAVFDAAVDDAVDFKCPGANEDTD